MEYPFDCYKTQSEYRKVLLKYFSDIGIEIFYDKNEILDLKGEYVYLITDGRIKQYFINFDGKEKTILLLSNGDMFGEITLFQGEADVLITETIEFSKIRKIGKDTFDDILANNPDLIDAVLKMETTKFRILMAQLYDNSFFSTKYRLFYFLKRLSEQLGTRIDEGTKINIKLTHQDIANLIGTTRSTVTKLINDLIQEGIIKIEDRYIIILDGFQIDDEKDKIY